MQLIRYIIMFAMVTLLAGCVSTSDKQLKLAQQSMQQGNYEHAFDQAAQSLQAEIGNYKTINLFSNIAEHAYAQKLDDIERHKSARNRDQVAYGYDRIIAMNQTITQLQQALTGFAARVKTSKANRAGINSVLAIRVHDVTTQRNAAYEQAAAAHYARGKQLASSNAFRQAHREYSKTLSFIDPYKDAQAQAAKSKHLADLADAKSYYGQGLQAVQQHQHRAAAIAFSKAYGFIASFKDARALAEKYKHIADLEDALARYQDGQRLAENHQYRAAARAFHSALSFVPGYRDAHQLATHYTDLANRADARRHYAEAMRLMDDYQFARAARAFDKADQFVPSFRDARYMAEKARSLIPPASHQLRQLVQDSVAHGIPLSWLHDVHRGYTEDVQISSVRIVRQGHFNARREFWPYKLRVIGTSELEFEQNGAKIEQQMSFDTVVDYRIFRDDFGDWKAAFRSKR